MSSQDSGVKPNGSPRTTLNIGFSAKSILLDKIINGFMDETFNETLRQNQISGITGTYGKDTWYRFDQMHANWEILLLETAQRVIRYYQDNTETKSFKGALVIDDTLFERTVGVHNDKDNSRVTELVGTVFDHTIGKNKIGFRMMTAIWTNGCDDVPVCQALLATRNPDLMIGPLFKYDKRSWEGKRRDRALTKGTDVMVDFVNEAIKMKIEFDVVLADTWFSNPAQAIAIKELGVDFIAMVKQSNVRYGILPDDFSKNKNEIKQKDLIWLDVKKIFSRYKKRRGTSKYLLSVDVWVKKGKEDVLPMKLVYARNRNYKNRFKKRAEKDKKKESEENKKEKINKPWVAFICTNLNFTEEEILKRYCIRWSIERYFKIIKHYLKLKDCHSTSYDALTCRITIVALRFMLLSVSRFDNSDDRTLENIFSQSKREVSGHLVNHIIGCVCDIFLESVNNILHPSESQMEELINDFLGRLPEFIYHKVKDAGP